MNGEVTVREAMTPEFVGVSEGDDIVDAAALLLDEETPGAVVLRGSEPVGMLTDRDVLGWLVSDGEGGTVADAMRDGVPTISPNQSVEDAAAEMFSRSTSQLLVVNERGELQGVLTRSDIVATTTLAPVDEPETEAMEDTRREAAVRHESETTVAAGAGDGGFSEQGICERCGALAGSLASVNGELLCSDCRDI